MSLTAPSCTCDSALRGIFGDTWRCPVHGTRETRDELVRLRETVERYRGVLEELATEDYRGPRPASATKAYYALHPEEDPANADRVRP